MAGTFAYTPPATTVLSAGTAQSLSVTSRRTDGANYTTATSVGGDYVLKATPVITWANPATSSTHRAERDAAHATATVPARRLTSPATTVSRPARAVALGHLHADRRRQLHGRRQVGIDHVLKATPIITGRTPADIVYGTALSADAAERDDDGARNVRLYPSAPTVLSAGTRRTCR